MKKYLIHRINNFIESEDIWEQSIVLKDFSHPWRSESAKETCFRALYDTKYLYLRYDVKDENINIFSKTGSKIEVVKSDRVEIFFRKNNQLEPYYCLEIDPNGKILDYSASYYRKFDYSWVWPKGQLFVEGFSNSKGYRVDVKISLESLEELDLLHNKTIEVGIFRADCTTLLTDDEGDSSIKWISWVDPKTQTPDFHVPSSFGVLELT